MDRAIDEEFRIGQRLVRAGAQDAKFDAGRRNAFGRIATRDASCRAPAEFRGAAISRRKPLREAVSWSGLGELLRNSALRPLD